VLFAHSWIRWIVLVLGFAVLIGAWRWRRVSAAEIDPRLHRGFLAAVDLQFALGLLMYVVLSPITRAAFSDMGTAMGVTLLRFYSVEHVFGMTVAVIAAHVGHVGARGFARDEGTEGRGPRAPLVAQAVWLVATLVSIPWPGVAYGRPLFRLVFPG